jgi:6-pyruvoyltetrahydropterin/6-carboxytetrahydropterin synthase
MRITKSITFAAGHRLLGYQGLCANIHGHNYRLEVTLDGPISKRGFVIDFKDLKKRLESLIEPLDHALILERNDPLCALETKKFIMEKTPTAENMVEFFQYELPENVCRIRLYETETSYAEFSC